MKKKHSFESCNARYETVLRNAHVRGLKLLLSTPREIRFTEQLRWECSRGHVFTQPYCIIYYRKFACTECRDLEYSERKLERMHASAHKRGGVCLATKYEGSDASVKWRCAQGHEWESRYSRVVNSGTWCPQCAALTLRKKMQVYKLQDMHRLARIRGGSCLSDSYKNSYTKLLWKCKKGHKWSVNAESVLNGTWCSICSRQSRFIRSVSGGIPMSMTQMRKLALAYGGLCLSKSYAGCHVPLHWRCKHGHEWKRSPTRVKRGLWCSTCRAEGITYLGVTEKVSDIFSVNDSVRTRSPLILRALSIFSKYKRVDATLFVQKMVTRSGERISASGPKGEVFKHDRATQRKAMRCLWRLQRKGFVAPVTAKNSRNVFMLTELGKSVRRITAQ